MGLFSKRTTCTVCNCNESKKSLADGYICKDCISKCYPYIITMSWKNYKTDEIRMAISKSEKNKELLEIFTPTKTFKKMLSVDANHKLWMYGTSNIVFNFNDVVSYELIQDGESITKGGVGRAVAGGILFGGVGAVVGGLTGKKKVVTEIKEYALNVVTKNEFFPKILINFLTVTSTKSNSIIFKTAQANSQNIMAEFDLMIESTNSSEKDIQLSSADELRKFKNLLDDGIITQAEFDLKKKQLLEL